MLFALKLIIAVCGLSLPGFLFARVLRIRWSLAVAFPFSALLLTESLICLSVLKIPIRFGAMAIVLGCWIAVNLAVLYVRPTVSKEREQPEEIVTAPQRGFVTGCMGVSILVALAVMFRSILYPLSGFDTFFRWEALARDMLLHESLNFYPPVSAADYAIYFYPDGIPPLVSSVYWWLYACMGEPLARITSVSVILQYATCLALVFYGALQMFGSRAAWFSLVSVSASTLFVGAVSIGQETGFTALAVAGQLAFAFAATRKPKMSYVAAAAICAALGALARDYGPALVLSGFVTLAWHQNTRRYLVPFVVIATVLAVPWYLRSWALTGNPLYSHAIPGGFYVNPVYAAVMKSYKDIFSIFRFGPSEWAELFSTAFTGAPLAMLAGVPFCIASWRKSVPLTVTIFLVTSLWVWSIGQTSGGGLYSMRMLAPAVAVLSIPAGAAAAWLMAPGDGRTGLVRAAAMVLVSICSLYSVTAALSHPFSPKYLFSAVTYAHTGTPELCEGTRELVDRLESSRVPATGVLTSNAYLATILQRGSRFRPVVIWSPEVEFVFNQDLDEREIRRRLAERNIRIVYRDNGSSVDDRFLSRFTFFRATEQQTVSGVFTPVAAVGSETMFFISEE